ncbi:MBL fold metallo-hydrolase [Candidatus Babeliales bacterium]|nr:MBL fold metallo-hydrolase [Candidatus Babeliales bacterium]
MDSHEKKFSPCNKDGRFANNKNEERGGVLSRVAHMLSDSWNHRIFTPSLSTRQWHRYHIPVEQSYEPIVTWIGHSSFLVQVGGMNILTDPVFTDVTVFFPRIFPPGVRFRDLPPIDMILISHNHLDHMHANSLRLIRKFLKPDAIICVPQGDGPWFRRHKYANIEEFSWWQYRKHHTCTATFLPAYHWSQRGLLDYNKALWGSWMIQHNGFTLYFGGDSAYANHFSFISKSFPSIDCALLPIAPCEPRELMKHTHMNAEEAGEAFLDLRAKALIPMHWGTFYFGKDTFITPLRRIHAWWQRSKDRVADKQLLSMKFGSSYTFKPTWIDLSIVKTFSQVSAS